MLLGKSIKNDSNSLYLYNKLFKIALKPNLYITSIFCRGLVYPSILTFPIVNLSKTVRNLYVFWKVTEKSCSNLYLLLKISYRSSKSNSYRMLIPRRGPVNLSTPIFGKINLKDTVTNLFAAWKFKQQLLK